jgi:hypothetical protein
MRHNVKKNKLVLLRLVAILSPVFFCAPVFSKNFAYQFAPTELISNEVMQVENISSIGISSQTSHAIPLTELSGLAWDERSNILYAVSDAGYLYHLKITLENGKLSQVTVLRAYHLRNKKGKIFSRAYGDAEGLTLKRNQQGNVVELIISFERKIRIARFNVQGQQLGALKLPKILRQKKQYRSKNKGLESVTLHPDFGVISAAELPLKNAPVNYQTLYSNQGKLWHFKQSAERNSAVTGLETMPDGNILVLERSYNGLFSPIIIRLRKVNLSLCNQQQHCNVEDIAVFNSIDGWRVDNFEGLTHYKNNQYLMISDDNQNPLQNTVLVLLTIKNK